MGTDHPGGVSAVTLGHIAIVAVDGEGEHVQAPEHLGGEIVLPIAGVASHIDSPSVRFDEQTDGVGRILAVVAGHRRDANMLVLINLPIAQRRDLLRRHAQPLRLRGHIPSAE